MKQTLYLLKTFILFCLGIAFFTSCSSERRISNGLDEKEANEIVVFLASKGIDASKVQSAEATGGGASKIVLWDIAVNSDEAIEAMSILNQAGLPRRRGQNLLGIFGNVGLVPSDLEQKVRYEAGLAEQIASTIRKIDGVLDAEVQISFPQEDPLNPGKYMGKITASVFVKHSGVLDDPNSHLNTKIKRLVASSVTGLNYDDVTVIPVRARFSEMQPGAVGISEEEKQYVNIWSIIIAKESLTRFRIVFFSFVIAILALLMAMVWISWKIYPLLKRHGGFGQLFHLHPIKTNGKPEAKEAAASEEGKPSEPKKEVEEEHEKDVDIT